MARNERTASLQKQLHMKDTEQTYFDDKEWCKEHIHLLKLQTEEFNNKYAVIETRCQYLESVVKDLQDRSLHEQESTSSVEMLHSRLADALEKNMQWLAYNQQREAYVRGVLARMSWLEQHLNQANQALSQQHNDDHSDEREKILQMQEHYEKLLLKAKNERESLREQVSTAHHDLSEMQWRFDKEEREVDDLKLQLQTMKLSSSKRAQEEKHHSGAKENMLRAKVEDLKNSLDKERRRSSELAKQASLLQKSLMNHHKDQNKIAVLEKQVQITSRDLEDERHDCLYLQKHLYKVIKELCKSRDQVASLSERLQQQQDPSVHEVSLDSTPPPSKPSRDSGTSSHCKSLLDESFLECPCCRAPYPSSKYRELLAHLEECGE